MATSIPTEICLSFYCILSQTGKADEAHKYEVTVPPNTGTAHSSNYIIHYPAHILKGTIFLLFTDVHDLLPNVY